ncbi:4-hydroxy-tetrahydrodipicolinate synthase [Aliifodinibius sp. S!AR15-10]|uniref:4-hydroxy-tetrahydrodipicolinate synthase n=1 Tax=Aliifodinibius sp. S!AR15-10 TaxID=2950437 RepID=UPI0028665808|nr:4-hydroxy-tetrahydrodipicolinate synthase [Aliifodinibius sp. S!AR15-10]MDR8392167.1 4-hydroxy-tetrahydrodipicolinate synthase [Aliifodinibius sp. S!AR15-10]
MDSTLNDTNVWTALVTPMQENGDLDLEDLATLIHKQDEAGNGVLILGSTGEGLALGYEDKRQVVHTATSLNIDVPIMVGVGGFNLREQIEWIESCQEFGPDAFLLVTPLYAKPELQGQIEWFKALMDAANKPCMLYNVPSRTGSWLEKQALATLSDHPNMYAMKEAGGSIEHFQAYRMAAPSVPMYSGDDGWTPYFSLNGCRGLVSVMANVWPKATHRYVELCLEGNTRDLVPHWKEPIASLFSVSNPIPSKVLLKEKGWIKSSTLRPPLTDKDLKDTKRLLKADESITKWYEENKVK